MMIHAYQEMYLNNVQKLVGDILDYGINTCHIPGEEFLKIFANSTACRAIANGEPAYLLGKSGVETALEILEEAAGEKPEYINQIRCGKSPEYWLGWAVAYYQWYSGRSFRQIFKALPFSVLRQMYDTLHEADISKFVDIASSRVKEYFHETNLKRMRKAYGCSQGELASMSGVSLRSIQMYEQRRKDINRASGENLYRLSRALGCSMEDLLENPA